MLFSCIDRPFCFSLHLLVDIWVISTLLWIMLLETFICKGLCEPGSSSGEYTHRSKIVMLYGKPLNFWETDKLFSIVASPFCNPTAIYECTNFVTSLPTLIIFHFWKIIVILVGVKSHVTLNYISVMTNDKHLSICYGTFGYSLENYLFEHFFAHLKNRVIHISLLDCKNSD